jgi:hypothetical protein
MTWIEQPTRRTRRNRVYQDSVNPQSFAIDATLAPLHYESEPDSGVFQAVIDCTPVRVNNAQADGWRVIQNGWHYFIGKDLASHGNEDGWVGFAGRQGAHWFKFRLLRAGYMKYSTKEWGDISGAPSYIRANLDRTTRNITLQTISEQLPYESVATWSSIWTTPGSGRLDVSWRVNGDGLKEEITLNQAARTWITNNRPPSFFFPGTALTDVYFGFVFRLDVTDIPRVVKDGLLQELTDFDDDDGQTPVELQDSLNRLLAFLPIDDAIVRDVNGIELARLRLRKRIYTEGGNIYLLVGARADQLNALPAGNLVFDPTIDVGIGAGADDGYHDTTSFNATSGDPSSGAFFGNSCQMWARVTGITGLAGATITTAYYTCHIGTSGTPLTKIHAERTASPAAPTSAANYDAKTKTTAGVDYDLGTSVAGAVRNSPSIISVIQELADNFNPTAIQLMIVNDGSPGSGDHRLVHRPYEFIPADAVQLHIDYTAAATPAALIYPPTRYLAGLIGR